MKWYESSISVSMHNLMPLSTQYDCLLFDGEEHVRIATLPGMWERTVTVGSAGSKSRLVFLPYHLPNQNNLSQQSRSLPLAGALVGSSDPNRSSSRPSRFPPELYSAPILPSRKLLRQVSSGPPHTTSFPTKRKNTLNGVTRLSRSLMISV